MSNHYVFNDVRNGINSGENVLKRDRFKTKVTSKD